MRPIDADLLQTALMDEYVGIAGHNTRTQFYRAIEIVQQQPNIIPPSSDPIFSPPPSDPILLALKAVWAERQRQDALWGDQSGRSLFERVSVLGEEYGELCEAVNETCCKNPAHPDRGGYENIIKEATQVAAVAVQIIEAACRRKSEEGDGVGS